MRREFSEGTYKSTKLSEVNLWAVSGLVGVVCVCLFILVMIVKPEFLTWSPRGGGGIVNYVYLRV